MIVIDANILIRAVLGLRVEELLRRYAAPMRFMVPDTAIVEAIEALPAILGKRHVPSRGGTSLDKIVDPLAIVTFDTYSPFEAAARQRLRRRDESDWPILATALALDCPIWTEDLDFFGCGVATWTTDRIEIFFSQPPRTDA